MRHTQLLALTFRTPAGRIHPLAWGIAPGERAEPYKALMRWTTGMGGTVMVQQQDVTVQQQWSLQGCIDAHNMVVLSDWGVAIRAALRDILPRARHL